MHTTSLSNLALIPSITNVEHHEQQVIIDLIIDENLHCFQGHFENAPVVAGVVQLDWAIMFAQQHLSFPKITSFQAIIPKIGSLKFQKIMLPKMQVQLTLTKTSDTKFTFKYSDNNIVFSSAKVELT